MQIVRSAIGTAEKQQKIKEQYGDFLPGIICLFEYRRLPPAHHQQRSPRNSVVLSAPLRSAFLEPPAHGQGFRKRPYPPALASAL